MKTLKKIDVKSLNTNKDSNINDFQLVELEDRLEMCEDAIAAWGRDRTGTSCCRTL